MANQNYSTVIRTLFDEVYSKGNVNKCNEIFSQDLKIHDVALGNQFRGLQGMKEAETLYTAAFPGKKATIEDMYTVDDKVIVRWRCKGTHKGEFNGYAPTNKPIDVSGISIYRFANNKIVEAWQSWDRLGLYEQIGEVEHTHALHR